MDSAYRAKASEVHLVEQAMVAAIGAGLPITEPSGNMVVDIGGGTTDVAVISLSGIVYSRSVRVAGNEMDDAVMQFLKRKYNLLIGERTAEAIKIEMGSAYPLDKPLTMEIKGRNLIEGVPKTITIDDGEIREALSEMRGDDRQRDSRGAGAHAAGTERGYQRSRHRADRRRRDAEEPRPAHSRRDGSAGVDCGRSPGIRRARNRANAERFQTAPQDFDRLIEVSPMESLFSRYRNITVLLFVIFAQIVLLAYQVKNNNDVRIIRIWAVTAVTPLAQVVEDGRSAVAGFFGSYVSLRDVREQNRKMQAQVDSLKMENQFLKNRAGHGGSREGAFAVRSAYAFEDAGGAHHRHGFRSY